jgi:hypothetical protein
MSVTYRVAGNFFIGPDFSLLLSKEISANGGTVKRKELEYNFNVHQTFEINKNVAAYPLAGVNISKVTSHPTGEASRSRWITGINVGGGIEWKLKKISLFLEPKYVLHFSKFDVASGILLAL